MTLHDKIAAARLLVTDPESATVPVVLNGTAFTVQLSKLKPLEWETLVAENPPRTASTTDRNIGYNQSSLPGNYPVEHIRVDGEPMTVEEWQEFYGELDSVHRTNVGSRSRPTWR